MTLCTWNTKKVCKALVGASIRFFNCSKQTKNEKDMELKLDKGLELVFNDFKVWGGRINNSLKNTKFNRHFLILL